MPMSIIMFTTIITLCEFCTYQCSDLAMIGVLGHSKLKNDQVVYSILLYIDKFLDTVI